MATPVSTAMTTPSTSNRPPTHHPSRFGLLVGLAASGLILTSCMVSARPLYGGYGYATYASPGAVYYGGGEYGGSYYRAGYYHRQAPFVQVYHPVVVARPVAVYAVPSATVIVRGNEGHGGGRGGGRGGNGR